MLLFDILNLIGGLCLFLFGMSIMGQALERRAGNGLKKILSKLTDSKFAGLLTGLGITAIIQSSSATTVMVVGFVNSGLMTLKQSIYVIMGANIGTTVTAWILSLAGISSNNTFVQLLKPSSFTPVFALIGLVFYLFSKRDKRKDTGMILLGFATLMFGMATMSASVAGLKDIPEFQQLFITFTNPIFGVLAGTILTAIIQSSSASVGILQALSMTGKVSYGAAIPIIMGQNIGTCITALISSVGTNKNAKRAAFIHLSFNVIGTTFLLSVFYLIKILFAPAFLNMAASMLGIAIAHSVFNILCVILLFPLGGLLEKLVCHLIPGGEKFDKKVELDERLLTTPSFALGQCFNLIKVMGNSTKEAVKQSIKVIEEYSDEAANKIRECEEKNDYYEDLIASFLIKLSARKISENSSGTVAEYLKILGDFERISDHCLNVLDAAEEMKRKELSFSNVAKESLKYLTSATEEIMDLTMDALESQNIRLAYKVEPLEQVIDILKEQLRTEHVLRLQQGKCSIDVSFIWSDLLTNFERIADHCSNIAISLIDKAKNNMNTHTTLREFREKSEDFQQNYRMYLNKYALPEHLFSEQSSLSL